MKSNQERLIELCKRCVATYTADDIIKHLEEECKELLLSIDRLRRNKGTFDEFLEELVDVNIECSTVTEMLQLPLNQEAMLRKKLDKFEAMLNADQLKEGEPKKDRYKKLVLGEIIW